MTKLHSPKTDTNISGEQIQKVFNRRQKILYNAENSEILKFFGTYTNLAFILGVTENAARAMRDIDDLPLRYRMLLCYIFPDFVRLEDLLVLLEYDSAVKRINVLLDAGLIDTRYEQTIKWAKELIEDHKEKFASVIKKPAPKVGERM